MQVKMKEELFACAMRQGRMNCWLWDMNQGTVRFYNHSGCNEDFYPAFMHHGEILVEGFTQVFVSNIAFVGDYRYDFMGFVRKLLSRKEQGESVIEIPLDMKQDLLLWIRVTAEVVRNDKGLPAYAMGIWEDITEEKVREKQQQHDTCLMGTLLKGSIYDLTVNLDKNFCVADTSFEAWMEETRVFSAFFDQAMREMAEERMAKEDREAFLEFLNLDRLHSLPEDENFSLEYRRRYNGITQWFKVTINIFRMDELSDKWMYILVYDIDDSKKRELALEKMAATDALTGLYNRAYTIQLMEKYVQEHAHMSSAIVYMDLDNFKSVNDTLGHAAGDSMLICVADAMRSYFGDDAVLGRIGGDEFIMMCFNAESSIVAQMMASFVDYVGDKCQKNCPAVSVTVSLGYVLYPEFGSDIPVLADLADTALYEAKRHGKNMAVKYEKSFSRKNS